MMELTRRGFLLSAGASTLLLTLDRLGFAQSAAMLAGPWGSYPRRMTIVMPASHSDRDARAVMALIRSRPNSL